MLRTILLPNIQVNTNLVVRQAQTKEDYLSAFKILYQCYRESGSQSSHESELRVTPFHLLPTTVVLLLELEGKTIGTMSVILNGAFGLPISKVYSMDRWNQSGPHSAEFSSLAILKDHRGKHGENLFPLLIKAFVLCRDIYLIKTIFICIRLFRRPFYEDLLGFTPISKNIVRGYAFSNGATIIGEVASPSQIEKHIRRLALKNKSFQNLVKILNESSSIASTNFALEPGLRIQRVNSLEFLRELVTLKSDLLSSISLNQKLYLGHLYKNERAVLNILFSHGDRTDPHSFRHKPRLTLALPITVHFDQSSESLEGEVLEVSSSHLRLKFRHEGLRMVLGSQIEVRFQNEIPMRRVRLQIVKFEIETGLLGQVILPVTDWENWVSTILKFVS